MEGNLILRLSEAARKLMLLSNASEERKFQCNKTLALFLWFLGEWEASVRSKKPATAAIVALWKTITDHIEIFHLADTPEAVNGVFGAMTEHAHESLR